MYDAQMYDAHIRDPCSWSLCMHKYMMHVGVLPCTPAAAPPIESRIKFCDILLLGGAAAGANKGTMGLGCDRFTGML